MKIYLCRDNLAYIQRLLQAQLPDDEVLLCAAHDVVAAARDAQVLIPTFSSIDAAALAAPHLKLVQQFGAGLDGVDIAAATANNVLVANVPAAGTGNAESVAELTLLFMLALARRYHFAQQTFAEGKFGSPVGMALKGKTAAIIGYGGIGREVARRLVGFDMTVLALSRSGPKNTAEENAIPVAAHYPAEQLLDCLSQADFVIVAPPLNEDTRGMIGAAQMSAMKAGAFIINVARGPVVDYVALLAALRSGHLAGAGLDVFWHEPFDPADPLLSCNVVVTPHVAGSTDLSLQGIADKVAENINRVRAGLVPFNCVNSERVAD